MSEEKNLRGQKSVGENFGGINFDGKNYAEGNFCDGNSGAGISAEENLPEMFSGGKNSAEKLSGGKNSAEKSVENFSSGENLSEKVFAEKISSLGGRLYVAGGWVRDHLIGRVPPDKDYVVCGLEAEFFARNFPARSVGGKFPVFLLKIDGRNCEVALARTEIKTGTGYRGFEAHFSPRTTIEEDLFRRDTTINSMAMEVRSGKIIDPFGGRQDIDARVIRATSRHFCEDPVRALRAARQASQLNFSIDEKTITLMRACRDELAQEPQERIFAETERALCAPHPELFFTYLRRANLLDLLFPPLNGQDDFDRAINALILAAKLTPLDEARFAALVLSFPRADLNGLDSVAARMALPRRWVRLARFFIENREKFARSSPEDVVELTEATERLLLSPASLLAVTQSALGIAPDFLVRYELYREILAAARGKISLPEDLPPDERGAWIKSRLADEIARHFFKGKNDSCENG